MSRQLTVYVIDDDIEVRRFMSSHLSAIGAEAWPFASGAEFLEIVDHLMPACILLDMEMPHIPGLDVLAELVRRGVDWPVIGLSARDELAVAVEAMKLGAIDFLKKPVSEASLNSALAPAWIVLEKSVQTNEARRAAQERVGKLTPREVDIALALLRGQANKTVAHQLGISVRTVEMHRAHIMAKLGVKSLAEAAVLATQAGLKIGGGAKPNPATSAPSSAERAAMLHAIPSQPMLPLDRQLVRSAV